MFILAITTDDKLVNQLKNIGQIMKCTSVDRADEMIKSGEFDAVIVGVPYTDINIKKLNHNNVIIVKDKNDIAKILKSKKKSNMFDEFASSIMESPEEPKPTRKLRLSEKESEQAQVTPRELGRILMVTTNLELVKYFLEFDVRVTTTRYSAQKALFCKPKIVIWDIPQEPLENPNLLLYKWGTDILHKEDVINILANADLAAL